MAYRSLKRVLGETSLERKCRFLFGTCLLLLITGAFLWVEYNAEKMVFQTTRRKGRDLVDMGMLKYHVEIWNTDPLDKSTVREMIDGIENQDYRYEVLAFNDQIEAYDNLGANLREPTDPWELEVLRQLKAEQREQMLDQRRKTLERKNRADEGELAVAAADSDETDSEKLTPVFRERPLPQEGEYHYFQPVYWEASCFRGCHYRLQEVGALSAAEAAAYSNRDEPFRVVKVVMPYDAVRDAINSARAGLIAAAILTVFMAMIALYVIVRYVIVKPLQHLRDVSDAISRGNTELRADIQTNDEFEELAASFNRMLRHLTDTQQELQQVNVDLDAKVDQLAQLNMRLYDMNRLKGDFLANMSHELRTPLNSIIGFSEVLQGIDSLTDKQKRYARNIQKSGRLLLEMINDILDLAKMEAGKMELRPSEFRIDAIVNAQCDMVRSLSEEKNIDLEVDVQPGVPVMYQDQSKVQQILTNLLSNAIKFTPEGGRIQVTARREADERLELIVSDTGVGIAEEDREIIFEKFRQSNAVLAGGGLTREYSGTGLGLSIVKELCKLLGGEISFESEVGKGSSFKVVLPWVQSATPRRSSDLNAKLDELTRLARGDFEDVNLAAAAGSAPLEKSSSDR